MEQDSIYWNDDFRSTLSKYCDDLFVDANLFHYGDRIFQSDNIVCWIDITNFIRSKDVISIFEKVKFCVAWLNTLPLKDDSLSCFGVVHVDDMDFDYMHHTDFTSYMQHIGAITLNEHIEINKEWIDITNGKPYYTLS